jgi:hypothetical protein
MVCIQLSKIGFCDGKKVFEEALNAVKFFGLAQKIWTITKHFGTIKGQGISSLIGT